MAKFRKFNAVKFTGRRWAGIDAVKEGVAKAQDLANKFTSLQAIHDEQGTDLEQTLTEIAESNMMMEKFGIETATTKGPMTPPEPIEPDDDEEDDDEPPKKKAA